ncbi:MAG: zf-HC2 domain-containing protein, partial [Chloroflexota bacterium]|nr:zf-HC2 domain-containing protein [Chloroflexota bacterium]
MYGNSGAGSDRHLTEDQFEELLREDLSPAGRQILQAHLSTCPDCRQAFDDYRAIAEILSNLPQVAVPRSFQLTPEMARVDGSLWRRLAAFLFPMLPAMRAATLALVLMLGAVTAARLVEDQADSPDSVEFASDLVPTSTAVQQPAPANAEPESGGALATETTGPAARKDPDDVNDVMMSGADEAPNDAADEASRSGPADEGADPAGSGPADGDAVIEESSQTGPADDVSDPAGTGPIDESDAVDESSGTGPADDVDPAGSGPADETEMESLEMEAPPGDAPAETTESFESAPADEDASSVAGSTEMQLPG